MSDDLIPSVPPQKTGDDHAPYKKAEDESGTNPNEQLGPTDRTLLQKTKTIVSIVAAMAFIEFFSLFLWNIADYFHGFWFQFVRWVSLCGQLAVFWYPISKAAKRPTKCWMWFIVPCIGIAVLVIASSRSGTSGTASSNFRVILNTADALKANLELTNDFFFAKARVWNDVEGYLAVPVISTRSNAPLQFTVLNDSGAAIELGQFEVVIDDTLQAFPRGEWDTGRFGTGEDWGKRAFARKLRSPMFPGDRFTPEIDFTPIQRAPPMRFSPMVLRIRAKDMPLKSWTFKITFFATDKPAKPFIMRRTDKTGTNVFSFPIPKDITIE